jgi:SAM-dependent methyltransferase
MNLSLKRVITHIGIKNKYASQNYKSLFSQRRKMNYMEHKKTYYRFFEGTGIDVGPFDKPFVINPSEYNINVKYVDHLKPEELKKIFPEIKDLNPIPPDYICDVSKEGLSFTKNETYDFIIYSHILEHVANPFFIINDAFRVLKFGGVLYISIPDCRFSNDKGRPKSTYRELENLFKKDIREISDDYVLSYLKSPIISKVPWVKETLKNPHTITKGVYDNERNRSFHVHVWDHITFFQHILTFIMKFKLSFSLLDLAVYENNSYENIILLRKSSMYRNERLKTDIQNLYLLRSGNHLPELDIDNENSSLCV